MFGASCDTVEANCAFAKKFNYSYKLLCDTTLSLTNAFGAKMPGKPMSKRVTVVVKDYKIAQIFGEFKPGDVDSLLAKLP